MDLSLPEFEKTIAGKVLDELGLIRYCCRTVLFTCIDLSEEISYQKLAFLKKALAKKYTFYHKKVLAKNVFFLNYF